ncbi:MAG: hypothetical protein WDN72_00280 [Alphaproteobacteria bacterium]
MRDYPDNRPGLEAQKTYLDGLLGALIGSLEKATSLKAQQREFVDMLHTQCAATVYGGQPPFAYQLLAQTLHEGRQAYFHKLEEGEDPAMRSHGLGKRSHAALLREERGEGPFGPAMQYLEASMQSMQALDTMVMAMQKSKDIPENRWATTFFDYVAQKYKSRYPSLTDDQIRGSQTHMRAMHPLILQTLADIFGPYHEILPYVTSVEMAWFVRQEANRMWRENPQRPLNPTLFPVAGVANDDAEPLLELAHRPEFIARVEKNLGPIFKEYAALGEDPAVLLKAMKAYEEQLGHDERHAQAR